VSSDRAGGRRAGRDERGARRGAGHGTPTATVDPAVTAAQGAEQRLTPQEQVPAGAATQDARPGPDGQENVPAGAATQDVEQPSDGQERVPAGVAPPPLRPTTPPDQVARAALARAQEAARARGLRPGDAPRRSSAAPIATAAGPDARDPQPVGVTAGRLAAELGWRPGLVEGDLRGRWPELVGPDIAEHCRPETFEAGLLTLRASSTAWATTLTLEAQRLLGRLAEELGDGVVVEVKVLGPAGPGFGRGRRSVPGRGARDTWG